MNARQLEALQALQKDQPRYSNSQIEAMKRNSPTADDILNNPEFMNELNDEMNFTISQQGLEAPPAEDVISAKTPDYATEAVQSDMDAELERLNKELERRAAEEAAAKAEAEAEVQPEMTREEMVREQILDLLKRTPGAPTEQQIEAMKRQYGQNGIQVLALGEGDVYIYTYLRRSQWKKIQEFVAKSAQVDGWQDKGNDVLQEKVIQNCVLWPKGVGGVEFLHNSRAGVMDTLYHAIMLSSYFLEPTQALQLTISL